MKYDMQRKPAFEFKRKQVKLLNKLFQPALVAAGNMYRPIRTNVREFANKSIHCQWLQKWILWINSTW